MLGTATNYDSWTALIVGLVLLALAPVYYKYQPNLRQHIRDTYSFKERPAVSEFQRIGGTLFLSVIGIFAIIVATIYLL
jgi:hypothetical protein